MLRPIVFAITSILAMSAQAAPPVQATPTTDARRPALPPPTMQDRGVESAVASEAPTMQPDMPDTRPVRDKAARAKDADSIRAVSDSVVRRQEGTDTVEEYREKGRLRMIRIVPQNGPDQVYMDNNNDGRLDRDPRDGPVSPVYFTIYQWN